MARANSIPEGFNSVNAALVVKDGRKALEFYKQAFGATMGTCMTVPGSDAILHAEIRIGNSTIMIGEENPQMDLKSAESLGGSPVSLYIYVDDVDATFQRAVDSGCTEIQPVADMFWGDRYGQVADPFGYKWGISTFKEAVPDAELQQRAEAWFAEMASGNA